MEWLIELGVFSGKSLVIVLGIIIVLVAFFGMLAKMKPPKKTLSIEDLNKKYESYNKQIRAHVEDHKLLKKEFKKQEKTKKKESKKKKNKDEEKKRIFVLEFEGDIKASAVSQFRDEITSVLSVADPKTDEVFVNVDSTGGMVHAYGLAASQLQRIKEAKLPLTIGVDKVAASGGYMMACTGDKIIAAPFAILGSIGVLAQIPNLHRLLKKHDVDYQEITAGEYKRTITMLGEITEKGKQKFVEQMEDTHKLFKEFVSSNRPSMDISKVATGEYWFGLRAKELGLVDEIQTSDDWLFSKKDDCKLIKVSMKERKKLGDKISEMMQLTATKAIDHFVQKSHDSRML